MKIQSQYYIQDNKYSLYYRVRFGSNAAQKTLMHTNFGTMAEGLIGDIKVRKADGTECFLKLYKKMLSSEHENYSIRDLNDNVVGDICLLMKKFNDYDRLHNQGNPNHIHISELINYSNPKTPYYRKGLEHYKDIGTRLMQIALKRSEECGCDGKIRLIAKNESKPWYTSTIGMKEEFPPNPNDKFYTMVHNPNALILPPEAKERLKNLRDGI